MVNRRGLGKAKHVDMQNLWIQEAFDLMTKPLAKRKIEQPMGIMGYDLVVDDVHSKKGRTTGTQ